MRPCISISNKFMWLDLGWFHGEETVIFGLSFFRIHECGLGIELIRMKIVRFCFSVGIS